MSVIRTLLLCFIWVPALSIASVDIRLSDDSAQFEYFQRSDISIGAGGSDISYALFYNDINDVVLTASLLAAGNIQGTSRAFNAAIGGRIYAGLLDEVQDDTIGAFAIGGKLSYVIPSNTPMATYFKLHIAPEITSFADIEGLTDWELGFELEVAPSASIYLGYRELEVEINGVDYELDDTGHVGLRFSF